MDWKFNDDRTRILLDNAPKRPKKITGTRLSAVLKLDPWKSDVKVWCEICRVYEDEFIENKYTKAGKTIEPLLIDWAKKEFENGVMSPKEFYGNVWKDVQKKYDFYPENKRFGGMWDARVYANGVIYADIEFKTSSRPQDWEDGAPIDKKVQSLLYSHLDKAKKTFLVVAFLSEEDYMHPERFVPVLGENVKLYSYDTETELIPFDGEECTIGQLVEYASQWWDAYVATGISPMLDYKADEMLLKVLKTQKPDEDADSDLKTILTKIDELEYTINTKRIESGLDVLESELKSFKEALKRTLIKGLEENGEGIEIGRWALKKTERNSIDTDKMKLDGIYENYVKKEITYTLRSKGEKA